MTEPASSLPPSIARAIGGKYEVRGVLGEGGTGVVYDATRLEDGKAVALKIMHPHLAGDTQIRGRFQREAAILRRLEGPHVCPILEAGEVASETDDKTVLYLALPKLEGPSLEEVLKTSAPLPVDRVLDVMLEICAALRSAHAQGIIHRDLKPANVILVGGEHVVVVDFGMSKIVTGAGTGTTNLTAHNMVFGTPEYMSPEQARGDELDARCDVYAAGVMLYEMLTGKHPFSAPTPLGVLTEHLTGELVPPSSRAPEGRISKALESVVLHALARDRDKRYPSASALAAAIKHARARPDDTTSLRPEAFATSPEGTSPFAVTMPATSVPPPATSSGRAIVNDELTSDTMPAVLAPEGVVIPEKPSAPPTTLPSGKAPSSTPPRAKGASSSPPGAKSASSKPPSVKPPSSGPKKRPLVLPDPDPTPRLWYVVWIVAAAASIALGVWFALRR